MRTRKLRFTVILAVLGVAVSIPAGQAWAGPAPAGARHTTHAAVDVLAPPNIPAENVMVHMRQFQSIATNNGGNRAHGRSGYRESANYVKGKLDAAGFQTTLQSFSHNGATGWNVIADWPYGDPNQVIFAGAHLDSVTAGPGMNDNASGSAAVLETALAVSRAGLRPLKRMRFGWWGAEELGLIGSAYYTSNLGSTERAKIKTYLNFDMVGAKATTNWGVYTDSTSLRAVFEEYFRGKGIPTHGVSIGGRSDHANFKRYSIPVSGIASGDDPCYHSRCDDINNIAASVMGVSTNTAAYAMWKLAGPDDPPGKYFENPADITIPDLGTAESPVTASGVPGNAPAGLKVGVKIRHTYRGDLVIDLIAPDGSAYRLKNSNSSDGADDVDTTYTVDASSEIADGQWRLRVRDTYRADTGYIDLFSLQF